MSPDSVLNVVGNVPLNIVGYAYGGFALNGKYENKEIFVSYTPEHVLGVNLEDVLTLDYLVEVGEASIWATLKMCGVTMFDDEIGYGRHTISTDPQPLIEPFQRRPLPHPQPKHQTPIPGGAVLLQFKRRDATNA